MKEEEFVKKYKKQEYNYRIENKEKILSRYINLSDFLFNRKYGN